MKEIGKRVWNEPSVAIGLLVTLVLLAGALIQGTDWGVGHDRRHPQPRC